MIKLFFDECCSDRLPVKLTELYSEDYPGMCTKRLADYVRKGSPDSEWISLLSNEDNWIVISADRGAGKNKEKLPQICSDLAITHILFTAGLHNRGYAAHKQALIAVWPELVRVTSLTKGTRISLGLRTTRGGIETAVLTVAGKPLTHFYVEQRNVVPKKMPES